MRTMQKVSFRPAKAADRAASRTSPAPVTSSALTFTPAAIDVTAALLTSAETPLAEADRAAFRFSVHDATVPASSPVATERYPAPTPGGGACARPLRLPAGGGCCGPAPAGGA